MDRHLTVLDAAAAVHWVQFKARYATVDVAPEDFHREAEHVKNYHRRHAAPQATAVLEALAPMMEDGAAGESTQLILDLAGDIKELGA